MTMGRRPVPGRVSIAIVLLAAACTSTPSLMPSPPFMPPGTAMLTLDTKMNSCPDPTGRLAVVAADPPERLSLLFPAESFADTIKRQVPVVIALYPTGTFGDARKDSWDLCIEGSAGDGWTVSFHTARWEGSPLAVLALPGSSPKAP